MNDDSCLLDLVSLGVAFQPVVNLSTNITFGFEALGRATLPSGRAVSPLELLDHAYRAGRLLALDRAWRLVAIERVAAWEGRARHHRWFLNVDTRSVEDPAFAPGFTQRALDQHGLSDLAVVIELGERDPQLDAARLERLAPGYARQGFEIAIDDFGTGHASFELLLAARPAFVKLDRGLVLGVARDRYRKAVVRSLVQLADDVGTILIAEGIETEEDLVTLHDVGVRLGQGYFLGRPATLPSRGRAAARDHHQSPALMPKTSA